MRRLARYILTVALMAPLPVQASQIFGLVIGIDEYAFIPDLDGAVNDARDITEALETMDAEVVTLLNRDATRDAIFAAWRDMATRMQPGDKLIVSYAGHGSNEPEHFAGNEEDGRDETFLLSGFSPFGAFASARIRDDEIAELIDLTPDADIIFVADACHSGTVSRNISPVLGYRYVSYGKISDDPLPPPPPNTSAKDGQDSVALFLAAVDEADKVPEFLIDGQARGALSYAFATGLRGGADADGDNRLTKGEIETYVRRTVRGISQGIQSPQTQHAGRSDEVLFELGPATNSEGQASDTAVMTLGAFETFPAVSVSFSNGQSDEGHGIEGVEIQASGKSALLNVEAGAGIIRTMVGDIVSIVGPPTDDDFQSEFQAVVDKTRLVTAMQTIEDANGFEVHFAEGDRNYHEGDILTVQVSGRRTNYLSLFNIGSTGEISFLYPLQNLSAGLNDPRELEAANRLDLSLQIAPPFGADHVFAIETASDPAILRRVLSSYDGSSDVRAFWAQFRKAMGEFEHAPRFAVFPFHSIDR